MSSLARVYCLVVTLSFSPSLDLVVSYIKSSFLLLFFDNIERSLFTIFTGRKMKILFGFRVIMGKNMCDVDGKVLSHC